MFRLNINMWRMFFFEEIKLYNIGNLCKIGNIGIWYVKFK